MIRVVRESAETIVFYAPADIKEVPTAAQGRISTPSTLMPAIGSEVVFTIDSVDSLVSAEAFEGDVSLSFATATGAIRGRKYLLSKSTGERAFVEVTADGTEVFLSSGLPFAVSIGDRLQGIAISTSLSSAQTELEGHGLINVTITANGKRVDFQEEIEILRFYPNLTLNWPRLKAAFPIVERIRPRDSGSSVEDHLYYAFEYYLKPDLESRQIDIEYIKSWTIFEPAHALAVVYMLTKYNSPNDDERIRQARIDYERRLKSILDSPKNWYSEPDQENDQPAGNPVNLKMRVMRR